MNYYNLFLISNLYITYLYRANKNNYKMQIHAVRTQKVLGNVAECLHKLQITK